MSKEEIFASSEGAALLQAFEELVKNLNELSEGKYKCRGKIHTTAKGEAQFEVSSKADTPEEVKELNQKLIEGFQDLCRTKHIKVAGASS